MKFNFEIVCVDSKYCDYLRKYDKKVAYNFDKKGTRPYVGILFKVNNYEYFAPLSSPKLKHLKMKNTLDFYKIKNGELGAINFNNMIPVNKNNYKLVDLEISRDNIEEIKYKKMLREQLTWLNAHYNQIKNKSYKLYDLYTNNRLPDSIKNRCCNFILLEQVSSNYKNRVLENV